MTREEAIKWLNYHINITDYEETDELYIALKMAIEALEQEPCEDCIIHLLIHKPKLDTLDKIRAEIDCQEKWIMSAGCNAYNVDIAFNSIKSVLSESEVEE